MAVATIDHVNIRTAHLPETIGFYTEGLGMAVELPPGFKSFENGAWVMGADGHPVIHLVRALEGVDAFGTPFEVEPDTSGSGTIDHIALNCNDYDSMKARLERAGYALRFNEAPEFNIRQILLFDPNDIKVELNFR